MARIPFSIVDAFCIPNEPFTGNQAAVCVLPSDDSLTDEIKQKIAAELNLSETAFVSKSWYTSNSTLNDRQLTLRWFTPETEVTLCGHATLSSARAVFETMKPVNHNEPQTTLEFQTKFKGTLTATMNWSTDHISLDFPLAPPIPFSASQLNCLPQLLIQLLYPFSASEIHSVHYSPATKKLLVRLHGDLSENDVKVSTLLKLKPNYNGLTDIKDNNMVMGIIVTVKGSQDVNFYSRYFAPWVGINEDPVTGSAHTVLTPYWAEVYGRRDLLGKQCSKRSGLLWCKLKEPGRVCLEGLSEVVVWGELTV